MQRRILAIFMLILAGLFTYLYARVLAPLHGHPGAFWTFTILLFTGLAAIAWLPLFFWASDTTEVRPYETWIERTAHIAMGFLSLLLFFAVARDLALIPLLFFEREDLFQGPSASLILLSLSFIFGLAGISTARRGPVVRMITLTPALPEKSLRLVQISDLHAGTWIGQRYVEKIVAQILALGPIDLLVLTGDIGDGDPKAHIEDLAPLGKIPARLGKFAVSGNHEGYWNETEWNTRIRELGFRILENESVLIESPHGPVSIHGISDLNANAKRALAAVRSEVFSIFLAHQPKHAEAAIAAGIRLQLSGHTHQGQFLPWSLFIGFAHRFAAGLYRVGKTAIYVNRGTGFWGPPFRVGTRSEITLIEFSPKTQN